jgi:hypothetical protein
MSNSTVEWKEKISRGTAIALMNNFASVAEALKELVDNPIDYRQGQKLSIEIVVDKRHDRLIVTSDGGRGMGAEDIQVWLNWGEGEDHLETHIGHWHQGGKAACGFLGRHVRLWAKRAHSNEVWFLEDENWGDRREPKVFGIPAPVPTPLQPESMRNLEFGRGHVRLEVSKLNGERRWNIDFLKREVANTYRRLLEDGELSIRVDGEYISPLHIPLSTSVSRVDLEVKLPDGRRASGWAGRMQRDQLTGHLKSGLRLVSNGRLVREGEWFGYNYEGKGALNSLIGELDLKRFTASPNKTDFVERGDKVWDQFSQQAVEQLMPLITNLRQSGVEERVSKAEKERAAEVATELEKAFASLSDEAIRQLGDERDEESTETGPGGRRKRLAEPMHEDVQEQIRVGTPPKPRTPPPEDPVGSLIRLLGKISGGNAKPPLRIRSWEPTERSAWTSEGPRVWLDINKSYHLYRSLGGRKPYLAETAILEFCKPHEGESMTAAEYVERSSLMLLRWHQVAGFEADD